MRKARDKLLAVTSVDIRTVRLPWMAGMAAYHAITSVSICNSFESTGMWPMDYRFLKRFQSDRARHEVLREGQQKPLSSCSACAVQKQNYKAVFEKLKEVVNQEKSASLAIKRAEILLKIMIALTRLS